MQRKTFWGSVLRDSPRQSPLWSHRLQKLDILAAMQNTHTRTAISNPSGDVCRAATCPSLADRVQYGVCISVPQRDFLFFLSSRVWIMSLSCVTTSRHTWSDTSAVRSSCGNTLYCFTPQIRHKRAYITPYLVLEVHVTDMFENMSCCLNEKCLGTHTHTQGPEWVTSTRIHLLIKAEFLSLSDYIIFNYIKPVWRTCAMRVTICRDERITSPFFFSFKDDVSVPKRDKTQE